MYVRPKFYNANGMAYNPSLNTIDLKTRQISTLNEFEIRSQTGSWRHVHTGHFDWWMFPIEDGSKPEYNVLQGDVMMLVNDWDWLVRYRRSVELVSEAWGWDIYACKPKIDNMKKWTGQDIRLSKIIRSLWIFEQYDMMRSMQLFARYVKPNKGLTYNGICLDEVYYMQ